MATLLTTWEQTSQYDPLNPNQITQTYYAGIPGGYASFYYNKVPTKSTLLGLGDTTIPDWLASVLVGAFGVGLGVLGAKYALPYAKKHLHHGKSLSGYRRRRR